MPSKKTTHISEARPYLIAYYLMLLVYFAGSFFPEYRVWGFSLWAHFPTYVPFLLFIAGALFPFLIKNLLTEDRNYKHKPSTHKNKNYFLSVLFIVIIFGILFLILRAKTFFWGDGYTVLSILSDPEPILKQREIGESLIHLWLKSTLGGDGKSVALLSFQVISITSGILMLVSISIAARSLFNSLKERSLFLLGTGLAGYMLLFFGYVEYYSIFVFATGLFCLTGVLITRNKLNRWFIIPPLILAIFLHVLGITLIPAAVYVIFTNSRIGNTIKQSSIVSKTIMVLISVIALSALFYYFHNQSYFFRFAVLPVVANSFTPDGYTLFSSKHLLDMINLIFLLSPPIILFIIAITKTPLKEIFKNSDYLFLLMTTVVTLGAVFLFDPKLGMPRDWDLFSYTGVPLTISGFYVLLDNRLNLKGAPYAAILAIALCLLTLFPRTFAQIIPDTATSNFKNYLSLDKIKSRPGWFILFQYLRNQGNITIAEQTRKEWLILYPETKIFDDAKVKLTAGRYQEAVDLNMQAIELNPIYHEAYANLGAALSQLNMEDSALKILEIARGLNPHNSSIWTNMGRIYLKKRMYPEAEDALLKAIDLKKECLTYLILARMHKQLDHYDKYHKYLEQAASQRDAIPSVIKELGDYYLLQNEFGKAAATYRNAVRKGLDKSIIDTIMNVSPQLKNYYREF